METNEQQAEATASEEATTGAEESSASAEHPAAEMLSGSRQKQTADDIGFEVSQEILDVMNFDPFPGGEAIEPAPEKGESADSPTQQPSDQKTLGTAKPAEGEGETPADPATPQAPQAAPASPADPTTVALQAQVQSLTARLAAMQQAQEQSASQKQEGSTQPAKAPDYMFNVPDQLLQLLGSEDTNQVRQGVQALMAGLGQSIHGIVMEAVEARMAEIPTMITQGHQQLTQKQVIFDDFYKAHSDLNRPELYPVVAQAATQVQAELGANSWSPQLRDAIATRVRQSLGQISPNGRQVPAAPATPAAQPPALLRTGVSPAPPQSGNDVIDDIERTLLG